MAEHREGPAPGEERGSATSNFGRSEAVEKLRSVVDQTQRSIKDWTQAGEHWAQEAQGRAREVANELRGQSERAIGAVSHKVEHNPLASLAVAFAVGFVVARLTRR